MSPKFLRGASLTGTVAPECGRGDSNSHIEREEMAQFTAVSDDEIMVPVTDYGEAYPSGVPTEPLGYVTYGQLRSGEIEVDGKKIPTSPLSSYSAAREIAETLKEWIGSGRFLLGEPQETLPSVPFEGFES